MLRECFYYLKAVLPSGMILNSGTISSRFESWLYHVLCVLFGELLNSVCQFPLFIKINKLIFEKHLEQGLVHKY